MSLLLTIGLVILLILMVVNWSFQRGFVSYARQNEVHQVESVASRLSETYSQQGSWDFLRHDNRQWSRLLESAGIVVPPRARNQRPPPDPAAPQIPAPAQRGPDLEAVNIPLAHRIVLLDANREPLAGPMCRYRTISGSR